VYGARVREDALLPRDPRGAVTVAKLISRYNLSLAGVLLGKVFLLFPLEDRIIGSARRSPVRGNVRLPVVHISVGRASLYRVTRASSIVVPVKSASRSRVWLPLISIVIVIALLLQELHSSAIVCSTSCIVVVHVIVVIIVLCLIIVPV
jgi:hypothetical protein